MVMLWESGVVAKGWMLLAVILKSSDIFVRFLLSKIQLPTCVRACVQRDVMNYRK